MNPAAHQLGRIGGRKTSEAKAAAARENGAAPVKPGSKPRGRPRKAKDDSEPANIQGQRAGDDREETSNND